MTMDERHIKSIPPGAAFLPTLVDSLLNGELIEGFAPKNDPLALSSVTIWLPTRRAVRALASEFSARLNCSAALLPNLKALGDVDDDEVFFDTGPSSSTGTISQPVMGGLERHLMLAQLVTRWADTLNDDQRALYDGAEIVMPSSLADAVWFAADLARLMDTVATEEADWKNLETLVGEEHAHWWQLTLEFLKIATEYWPKVLQERGCADGNEVRASMLRAQAEVYRQKGSAGPVIAAGSTGSIPATANLLKSIAELSNGVVVLPGLDRDLDEETWEKIDLPDNDRDESGTAPGHPQYGLKKLLKHFDVSRGTLENLHIAGASQGSPRVRETLVSMALRPYHATAMWQEVPDTFSESQRLDAFKNVQLVEAKSEREEAMAIALALRETLTQDDQTAALVTPDRNLARRVAIEMRRFGVDVDDSAGQPLNNRPAGAFVRLILKVAFAEPDPVALVSLIKHPFAHFGRTAKSARHAARLFELAVLRGAIAPPVPGEFHALLTEKRQAVKNGESRVHRSLKRFSTEDWEDVSWLALKLDEIFEPMHIGQQETQFFAEIVHRTIALLEACAVQENGGFERLYGGEDGKTLRAFLNDMLSTPSTLEIPHTQWPDIFDALLGQRAIRPLGGTHPRLTILGPLEARLQTFDRVVLAGLNEGAWPATARNDPFLSRPMKSQLGLPPPERRTGLAAHDFQMLMGIDDVVLTRSMKSDNAPTVASRWVQRLATVVGAKTTSHMRSIGNKYLQWARQIDQPEETPKSCSQPRPTPPVETRPTSLSITEIEKWIADPYAIYARHILKLDALDPLLRQPDARERGTLYHAIVEDFVREVENPFADDALKRLLSIARQHFDLSRVPDEHAAQWWPRFETIAAAFIEWHREQLKNVKTVHVELGGNTDVDLNGFTLRGRVDRIDLMKDGRVQVFDYKTGKTPSLGAVKKLDAPQLLLSAAMAKRGAFNISAKAGLSGIGYLRLRPEDVFDVDFLGEGEKSKASAEELTEASWETLNRMIAAYRDPKKDYRSKARLMKETDWASDYDHLGRVLEWSTGDDGEGEA